LGIDKNKQETSRKLDERILPRDLAITLTTAPPLEEEAKDRDKLVPR
jgi:hypothetical protein